MFIFLSKILPLLVYPTGFVSILIIAGILIKKKALKRLVLIAAFAVLWLSGNQLFSMSIFRSLEWRYLPPEPMPEAQAIVVLGGGTDSPDYPRPIVDVTAAGDRVLYAGSLFKDGKAPLVLLSGGNISWMGERSNTPADQMAWILEMMDIPRDVLILQTRSQNTHEDALYSSQLLKEMGIQKIILVTSALHMPRSVALFEKQGMEVIPAPTDYRVTQTNWAETIRPNLQSFIISLIPSASNVSAVSNALKEYIGIIVYRMRGWI